MSNEIQTPLARLFEDEEKVRKYLLDITNNQIGAGDDPIGLLIASHAALLHNMKHDFGRGVEIGYKKAKAELEDEFDEGFESGYETAMEEVMGEEALESVLGSGWGEWPNDDDEEYPEPEVKTWVN